MKMKLLPFMAAAVMSISSLSLSAAEDASTMDTDDSVKKSDRKTVFGLSELGLETTTYTFPVTYCPLNGNCYLRGSWSITIDQAFADNVLQTELQTLISNRFDKVIASDNDIAILTPTQDFNAQSADIGGFDFETGSKDDFNNAVLGYLNGKVAGSVREVLDKSKEVRYESMDDAARESFMNTQAKESGIPMHLLEKLMGSSYAFALYLPQIVGSITVSQVERTRPNGSKYIVYSSSLSAPLNTELYVYSFDYDKYKLYKVIDSKVKGFDVGSAIAKMISGSGGITTPSFPSNSDGVRVFHQVFKDSFKDSIIAIQNRLKEDRSFAISAPVSMVEGSTVYSNIGNQEDIRVDHPMYTYTTNMEGESVKGAWIKVRKPGNNCLLLPAGERTESEASIVRGDVEEFDLAVEVPYTGVFFGLEYENIGRSYTDNTVTTGDDQVDLGQLNLFSLYFNGDLGYILNKPFMSEVWMNLDLGVGSHGSDITGIDSGTAYQLAFGLTKRFDISNGIYIGAGADLSFIGASNTYQFNSTLSLQTSVISLRPEVSVGYQFSPFVEVNAGLGYDLPFSTSAAAYIDTDKQFDVDISANSGVSLMFSASYHVDFAGPFAKMTARPSKACNDLKKQ